MAEERTYPKHCCFFCQKLVSGNGAAKASHYRKHVRSGEAVEIGPNHPEHREQIEFFKNQNQ